MSLVEQESHLSKELLQLFKLNNRADISEEGSVYEFVMAFRSEKVPDMVAFIKRLGDYIVYFDRKGLGLLLDLNNEQGKAMELWSIGSSEGAPRNAFLYEDTNGDPILVAYRSGDYGVWRYKDINNSHGCIYCYKDYNSQFEYGSKFCITKSGRMVMVTSNNLHRAQLCEERRIPKESKQLYYVSFQFEQTPYKEYKLLIEEVPKSDMPLFTSRQTLIRPGSKKRHNIIDKLSINSIPSNDIAKLAQRGYRRDESGKYYQVKDYSLNSVYAAHQYDDIILIGQDWGYVSVWKAK